MTAKVRWVRVPTDDTETLVSLSRLLSWMLRHEPHTVGLVLDDAGWAEVDAVLSVCRDRGFVVDHAVLARVVETSDKRRFALSDDGRRIRAVQGHSVPVSLGHPQRDPPPVLYHGTVDRFLDSIRREGLRPGQRHHVHLSADPTTAVAVGARRGVAVILTIRAAAMAEAGHQFFVSPNGVWLTEWVPPQFVEHPPA